MQYESVECVDSNSNADMVATPTNKPDGKRLSDSANGADDLELDRGATSTKPKKIAWVMLESADNWM